MQIALFPEQFPFKTRPIDHNEHPRDRLHKRGAFALSDAELLAILLSSGTQGNDVITLANTLVKQSGSLASLLSWSESDFRKHKGIGHVKALQLMAVMEIAHRVITHRGEKYEPLDSACLVAEHMANYSAGLTVEKFWAVCLNRKNRLIKVVEISSGIATAALAHPREVYRAAMREAACSVICAHNHPSGDPRPSNADLDITRQLREASKTVQIPLLDHVILGRAELDPLGKGYYSFKDAGLIQS
jgi:DNA repair protein RadC